MCASPAARPSDHPPGKPLFGEVRQRTLELCSHLSNDDHLLQSMPDASPAKWHLAHTTWLFEEFVLAAHQEGYQRVHPRYGYLFNSYYNAVGERHARPQRHLLTRPSLDEIHAYRRQVDGAVVALLTKVAENHPARELVELGLHHEQQHQELILTDSKHGLFHNSLQSAYRANMQASKPCVAQAMGWHEVPEGIYWLGHEGEGFAFDNELPRHRVYLQPFALSTRLVTNGEYAEFIQSGGYERSELWLSAGWDHLQTNGWKKPLYWEAQGSEYLQFGPRGMERLDPHAPVCHLSYFEADAYARFVGALLPTEAQWECVAANEPLPPAAEPADLLPQSGGKGPSGVSGLYGEVWQWTSSSYAAYPGFAIAEGAMGEYNGKFMCNQYVLRGGSRFTPPGHLRHSYRNFFPAHTRFQMSGIRLARWL